MAQSGTVLIAVRDSVLADSLRFSLELEGYEAKLCEPAVDRITDGHHHACLFERRAGAKLWPRRGEPGAAGASRHRRRQARAARARTERAYLPAPAQGPARCPVKSAYVVPCAVPDSW